MHQQKDNFELTKTQRPHQLEQPKIVGSGPVWFSPAQPRQPSVNCQEGLATQPHLQGLTVNAGFRLLVAVGLGFWLFGF